MRIGPATIGCVSGAGMLLSLVSGATPVQAQAAGRNPAAAQALYEEARRLVQIGNYDQACPKFKESYQLDPGGGTLLNLADCYERQGKTALGWSTFKEARVMAERDRRDDRVEFATQHLAALEARLARLTVSVPEAARVAGLSVSVDGMTIGEAAWGLAMPIDPGRHSVRAEAPGKTAFVAELQVVSGQSARETIVVPRLSEATSSKAPVSSSEAPHEARERGTGSKATIGWVAVGAGVVSLGVGSYFGLRAFSRWSDRKNACEGGCTEGAKQSGDDASRAATISTIGFGVGLAAAALGTVLLLSTRGDQEHGSAGVSSLQVGPDVVRGGAGVWMRGDF